MLTPEVRNYAIEIIKGIKILHHHCNGCIKEVPLSTKIKESNSPEKYLKNFFNNFGWVKSKNINGKNIVIPFSL